MTYKHNWMGWVLGAALFGSGLAACDDSNDNTAPTEVSSAGRKSSSSGGKGGSSSAGKGGSGSTSSGQSSESGKGGSGGKAGSSSEARGGSGGSESAAPQDCKDQGPKDCVCEAPKSDAQFLNHCSAATCNPYDNKKLSKLKSDGSLPALP